MSVYKPKNSPYYHYDFVVGGNRFHGSTGCSNRREAEGKERLEKEKAKAARKLAKAADDGPLTIGKAAARYFDEVGIRHANSDTTDTDLTRLVGYFGEAKLMADINDSELAKLIDWRAKQTRWGRDERADGSPMPLVTPATVNRSTILVLKKLFTRAKRTWRYTFPFEPIWNDHWLKEPKERVRELKKDEGSAITLATRPDYEPIFAFVRATGLRLNECILKWSEVDFETGWITKPGKGGRMVRTAITSIVREILEPLVGDHPEFVFTYKASRTMKVSPQYKGDGKPRKKDTRYPITYNGLKTQWKRIRKAAGVKDFRFHDFRHDLATKLLRDTGNLKTVQKALSHADIKTTTRYAHVLDEEVAMAMERLGNKRKAQKSDSKKSM